MQNKGGKRVFDLTANNQKFKQISFDIWYQFGCENILYIWDYNNKVLQFDNWYF